MQISVQETGKLEREMKIEVPEDRIAGEVKNRLDRLSRTTKVDGFRPGKVPFRVIQQRYGQQVRQEVVGEVVQSSFYEALNQENLRPAGSPRIGALTDQQGQGLSYTATFEIFPEPRLNPIEKLQVEKTVSEVTDADVDAMVEQLRRQRREPVEVGRESREGDILEVNFEGSIDGEPFEGGSGEGVNVELGSDRFLDGFESGLIGHFAGETVNLDLAFPEDYDHSEVAGKPVRFKVTINKVQEAVLPELNDEFFAQFGVTEGGEEAFRQQLRSHMEREMATALGTRQRQDIMDALYRDNPIDVPRSLIEEESQRMQQQFQQQLKAYGVADQQQLPDEPSLFEEQARQRVATQLIVMEIIRQQDFKADAERVKARVEQLAQDYEDPAAVIKWYYSDQQRLGQIEGAVLEEQVIDWISENAAVKEVPVTFDELMNKGQTDSK